MVTKFGLFSHKIGHNSAYTNDTAAVYEVFGHGQLNVLYIYTKFSFCTFIGSRALSFSDPYII